MASAQCNSWYTCTYDFQTLYSGALVVLAAVIAFLGARAAANAPIRAKEKDYRKAQELRRRYVYMVLSSDFQRLAARARLAEGTINAVVAAHAEVNETTRQKTRLSTAPIIDDWESMSLLPKGQFWQTLRLRQKVDEHNFDMDRAGGAFGGGEFQRSIFSRVRSIQAMAKALASYLEANAAT